MNFSHQTHQATYVKILLFFLFFYPLSAFGTSSPAPGDRPEESTPTVLTLQEAIQRTLHHNRDLHGSALSIQGNNLNLETSKSEFDLKFSPLSSLGYSSADTNEEANWKLGGRISKKFHQGIGFQLSPEYEGTDSNHGLGVSVSLNIPLLKGFGQDSAMSNIYSSEYALASSRRNFHTRKINSVLTTISSVYKVIREYNLIDLYTEQIKLLKHHLVSAKVKEKAGIATVMDIYRAEIQLKNIEDDLSNAKESEKDSINNLKNHIGLELGKNIQVTAPMDVELIKVNLEESLTIAKQNRIEIQQANADITEAKRRERLAHHNLQPELNLVTAYNRFGNSERFDESLKIGEDIWSVSLTSSTDFSRTTEKNLWALSRLTVQREELNFQTTMENISQQVRTILNSLEKTSERIRLREEQAKQASGKQELAHIKFKYGEAGNFDLIESQNQVQEAKINYLSEKIQYIIDSYSLRAAIGTLVSLQ